MNIAFTSLIIILFLLPGVLLVRAYFSGVFSDGFVERLDKLSVLQLVIRAILPSMIIHYLGLQLCQVWGLGRVNFNLLLNILVGRNEQEFLVEFTANLSNWQGRILLYNLLVNLCAFGAGTAGRILVRTFRLDRRYALLRYANEWHYLLSGEILEIEGDISLAARDVVDLRYVTALVDVQGQTLVYTGILENYKLSREKGVQYITLREARRRSLSDDAPPGNEGQELFYSLPGNYLIIPFEEVKNLHIEYIQLIEFISD